MLHALAYCLIAFGIIALFLVDRLGIGARAHGRRHNSR
jgi:hypothetical protein